MPPPSARKRKEAAALAVSSVLSPDHRIVSLEEAEDGGVDLKLAEYREYDLRERLVGFDVLSKKHLLGEEEKDNEMDIDVDQRKPSTRKKSARETKSKSVVEKSSTRKRRLEKEEKHENKSTEHYALSSTKMAKNTRRLSSFHLRTCANEAARSAMRTASSRESSPRLSAAP